MVGMERFTRSHSRSSSSRRRIPVLIARRTQPGRLRHAGGAGARPIQADGRLFPTKQVKKAFGTALRRARIENLRFRDLRHTAASYMVMRGRSLKEVQGV